MIQDHLRDEPRPQDGVAEGVLEKLDALIDVLGASAPEVSVPLEAMAVSTEEKIRTVPKNKAYGGKDKMKLKMYVWRGVLTDYTSGIACALAHNEDEARRVILRDAGDCERSMLAGDIEKRADEVYEKPSGVYVWGGG